MESKGAHQNFYNIPTEESHLLDLLLLGNSLYCHKNMWSRLYGSTFFVNHILTTGPPITWTSPYWTLCFRPKVHFLLAYLDFFSGLELSSFGRRPDN
jgi:hypothetical protein